ncbi:MAG: POTRA domain-containing protein [Polyangia bacterium]
MISRSPLPACWLSLLIAASAARAQDEGVEEQPAREDPFFELDHLLRVRMPGEGGRPSPSPAEAELVGETVVRVVAHDPPSGFQPVDEAEIPLGIELDRSVVRRAVSRLWATGNYREIEIRGRAVPGGVELLIAVEPMMRLRRLEVEGNRALDEDEISEALGYAADRTILPSSRTLVEMKRDLLALYAERGYPEAGATLRLETTEEPGVAALLVQIEEGKPQRYEQIRIPGLPEEIPEALMKRRIGIDPGTVRDRDRVERVVDRLAERLAEFGYPDAQVAEPRESRLGRRSLRLELPVDPGLRTEFDFLGNRRLRKDELRDHLAEQRSLRSDPDSLQSACRALRELYRRRGMFHARVHAERICVDASKRPHRRQASRTCADTARSQRVAFLIVEGPPVEIAALRFEGNERFDDERLGREVRAFLLENNAPDETFQTINTRTVDAIGISDPRPGRLGRSRGALAPVSDPDRIYVPRLFAEATEHLAELYREQGYLAVEVSDTCRPAEREPLRTKGMLFDPLLIERESEMGSGEDERGETPCLFVNGERRQLVAVVHVEEGPQTSLDEIEFAGNSTLASARLLEIGRLKIGQPYNKLRLREAARDIKSHYQSLGRMFAEVSWSKSLSPDRRSARISFEIREGPVVRAGRIVVRGNISTGGWLIRERLDIEKGDLVTPGALSESEQRLMELGFFGGATVQMADPSTPDPVKTIVVQVAESKPQYLELRGGMASVDGLRGGFEYGYRNLGGTGLNARLRARANYRVLFLGTSDVQESFRRRYYQMLLIDQIERHLLLGINTRHLPGTRGLVGAGIDGINERINVPPFSADRTASFFRLKSSYLRWLLAELHTGVEHSDITLAGDIGNLQANPAFAKWARVPEGVSTFWVSGLKLSLDFRDDPFNPSRGVFVSIGADLVRSLAGFAPQIREDPASGETSVIDRVSNLVRTKATVSGYIPLVGTEIVLALSASAGTIFHLQDDSTTWPDRYFYMGGVGTLRGFTEESLIPEDVYRLWKRKLGAYSEKADRLLEQPGGESMLLLRSELRYPLAKGFHGAGFFEAGNIWRVQRNMDPLSLRPVAGGGLRYMTPLGPVAFDVGVNLDRRPHEDRFAWAISIGSAF